MFRHAGEADPVYSEIIELDLETVEPSLAGPKRPQDRVSLKQAKAGFQAALSSMMASSPKKAAEAAGSSHVSAGGSPPAAAVAGAPGDGTPRRHGAGGVAAVNS